MFRTKKDVDHHVQEIFRKLQNENERTLRCCKIAELYYHVGDYESARRYLSRYVEVRKEAKAHKLMGQVLEALNQKESALVQYKYAFELDGRQKDLVLKVCELMADPEVGIDVNRAKYWAERADQYFPKHKVVFELKEKILSIERPANNEEDLEKLITAELTARPTDVQLRVKLLKHYMEKNKFDDAYKHAVEIEMTNIHRDSLLWYQALCDLFLKCKNSRQLNWSFWISYISSLERYAALSLKEQGNVVNKTSEAIQAVYNFDQHLFEAKGQSFSSYPSLTESIFVHMWGQLHFHMACLLLVDTKREQSSWSEAGRLCAPLLLTAMHVKPIDLTPSWVTHLDSSMKNQLQLWYRDGNYRCSQAAHVLHDYARGNQKKLIGNIEKFCSGSWRERVYQRIFVGKIYQKIRTSYFTNNNATNPPFRLISHNELKRYDKVAEEVWPYSLHHQIWPAIKNRNNNMGGPQASKSESPEPNLSSHLFPQLQFSVYNLNQASPVTLCRLDIDAFLNTAAFCASAVVEEQQRNNLLNPDRLPTLPADLTNPLCTPEQEKWWSAAYKMYRKEALDDIGDTRQSLQRGLEVVRCIGNHGLHPNILVHLARIFSYRAKQLRIKDPESGDIPVLEARAELYWSAVIPLLEKLKNSQTIRSSQIKLFSYIGREMNNMEITQAIEEGKLLLAQKLVRDKLYEQAIEALQALRCPEASFEQGKIYYKLADETINSSPKESVTSEMRSQHVIILSKARNCFYLTLDRLRSPDADPKHPLNAELCTYITKVENELKRIDPDTVHADRNRNDCEDVSEESYSSAHSDEHPIVNNSLPLLNNSLQTPVRNARRTPRQSSTPRQSQDILDLSRNRNEARPSPERLDAQIRQLAHSFEMLMEEYRVQSKTMISKLDELIKVTARKDTQKPRPQPPVNNHNLEDELYAYGEEDYRDYNSFGNPVLATPAASRTTIPQNLFAAPRHPYSPSLHASMMYPSPAAALQSYYQGPAAHLPFADAAAVASQALPGIYPPGLYPPSSLYRSGLEQPLTSMQQLTESSFFGGRMDLGLLTQQPQLTQQLSQFQLGDTAKPELKTGGFGTINEPEAAHVPKDSTAIAPATSKPPPVNVVITTSDTLPTTAPTVQPTLSVTIPAQHRLGVNQSQDPNAPHNYQISMPTQPTIPTTVILPPLSATMTITSPHMKQYMTDNQNSSILSTGSRHSSSDITEVEHDPIPDFAPIIPLPDEVPVNTGEENEEELFCARAKLFRFVDKEWKERGIGNVKLLRNSENKVRLLMRREQVHKICANHMLRKDMELSPMPNNDKAYMWVANDFADEELRIEKLCIRFKTAEEAANFKDHFENARDSLPTNTDSAASNIKFASSTDTSTTKTAAKADQGANKPVEKVGGFSFSASPIIQKPKSSETSVTPEKKPDEQPKPSPFASFSFVKSTESSATKSASGSLFNFGNFSATTNTQTPIFSQDAAKTILMRPEPIKVGDNEVVITEQNVNLMHFTSNTKIWNEKGSGVLRVLSDRLSGNTRFLMNKEDNSQNILNHTIPPSIIFNLKADTVNWTIPGDKNVSDSYLARFKNHEQASAFQKTITSHLQKSTSKSTSNSVSMAQKPLSELFKPAPGSWECKDCYTRNNSTDVNCISCQAPSPASAPPARPTIHSVSKNLFDKFKPPAGSWECKECYTRNNSTASICVACQALAPSTDKPAVVTAAAVNKPLSELFKSAPGSWECKQCYVVNSQSNQYCAACDTAKDPSMPPKPKTTGGFLINSQTPDTKSTFTFGIPQNAQPAANKESGFTFNLSKPSEKAVSSPISIFSGSKTAASGTTGFLFGTQPPPSTPPKADGGSYTFGSPGKSFDFQFTGKSPPVKSPEKAETSDDDVVEESDDVYFPPVIPLPDKVDVKTGEENEDVLYSHRAKLFKFDVATKEWKERGLGDIKLLQHIQTKKLRLVMRRDQVLKLCLNHAVTSALEVTPKDNKTWMWSAGDYSEGEIEYMQFACRFKTPEVADEFKEAVDNACKALDSGSAIKSSVSKIAPAKKETKDSSSDVEIVYEIKVTAEEKAAAQKLQLPDNFYAYKYKPDCPGCIGCRETDEPLFKTDAAKETPSQNPTAAQPVFSFGKSIPAFGANKPLFENGSASKPTPGFVFGGQMSFGTPTPNSQDTGIDNLKICSPASKAQTSATTATTTSAATSIFGFGATSNVAKPLFGGTGTIANTSATPVFGAPTFSAPTTSATTESPKNIFSGSRPPFGDRSGPIFGESTPLFGTAVDSKLSFGEAKTTTPSNIFSESKLQTSNIFGGSTNATVATTSTTNIFGSSANTSTNMFGGKPATTSSPTGSIFGTTVSSGTIFGGTAHTGAINSSASTASTTKSLFVSSTTPVTTTTTSLFGSTTAPVTTSNTPLFSSTTAPVTTSNTPLFGSTTTPAVTPAGTLFGSTTPLFGGRSSNPPSFASLTTQSTQLGSFGTTSFGNAVQSTTTTTPSSTTNIFSSTSNFTNSTSSSTTNLFTSTQPPTSNLFGGKATDGTTKNEGVSFLPTENAMSFSALAAQTSVTQQPAFKADPNFTFDGAGASVFGAKNAKKGVTNKTPSKSPNAKKANEDDEEGGEENENGDDHDPYFEPIIPLPDAIEVRTGEEDEQKVFCQRAKLYRYDQNTKEWKERGTGEMKLLHHADHGSFRLLLRREQVHKVVCNLLLTPDLEFRELNSSDRAWMWAGMNYAEPENPEIEQLAVRFKSPDLAKEFKEAVDKAQHVLAERQIQDNSKASNQEVQYDDYGDEYGDGDDYDDEDEDEDEDDDCDVQKMFEKRATLYAQSEGDVSWQQQAMGNIKVLYDSDLLGARIVFENDREEVVSDTVISIDTTMKHCEKECSWAAMDYAVDPPVRRTLKAIFSSKQTSDEMYETFQEGQDCARKADIRD